MMTRKVIASIAGAIVGAAVLSIGSIEVQFHSSKAMANDSGENNQGGSVMPGSMDGVNPTFHKEDGIFTPIGAQQYRFRLTPAMMYPGPYAEERWAYQSWVDSRKKIAVAHKDNPTRVAVVAHKPVSDRCNLGSERCEYKDRDGGSGKLVAPKPAPRYASRTTGEASKVKTSQVCQGVTVEGTSIMKWFCHIVQS